MTASAQPCPEPAILDELAISERAPEEVIAHVAKCRSCADHVTAARFGNRFRNVLSGSSASEFPKSAHMPEIFGYELVRELARGGQGIVYLATQLMTGQSVAIKVLPYAGSSGHARARLAREIEIIATLHHPGIVRLLDSVTLADGREALIMEYIEGVPLDKWRLAHPDADRRQLLLMLSRIAGALHHAHQRGVIHRDLKPTNILVGENAEPILVDFGIAAKIGSMAMDTRVTQTGEFTGTLTYAAPEQVSGSQVQPDVRTDVYALGVIGFEFMTGKSPYNTTGSLETVVRSILESQPTARSIAGLATDDWSVLTKAMAKEPSRRYQSSAELAEDLARAAVGSAVQARGESTLYVLAKAARRHRAGVAIGAITVAALLTVLAVLLLSNSKLRGALFESRLRQIHAFIEADARTRAEAILWPAYKEAAAGGSGQAVSLWEGPLKQRQLLWAFMEMQAKATCLLTDPQSFGAPITITLLDDGSIGVMHKDKVLSRLLLGPDSITSIPGPPLPEGTLFAWYTPSGSAAISLTERSLFLIDPNTGIVLFSRDHNIQNIVLSQVSVSDDAIVIALPQSTLLAFDLPTLEPLAHIVDLAPLHRPFLDRNRRTLTYLDRTGELIQIELFRPDERRSLGKVLREDQPLLSQSSVLLSPDNLTAIITNASELRILSLEPGGTELRNVIRPGYPISATIDPNGKYIAAVSFGGTSVRVWDTSSWQELPSLGGHATNSVQHTFTLDGSHFITADTLGTYRVWSLEGADWKAGLSGPTSHSHSITITNDGNRVLLIDDDGRIQDVPYRASAEGLAPTAGPRLADASHVCLSRNDARFALIGHHSRVLVFESGAGDPFAEFDLGANALASGVQFEPDGSRLAICTRDARLFVVDPDSASVLSQVTLKPDGSASDLAWVSGAQSIAVTLRSGNLAIYNPELSTTILHKISNAQLRSIATTDDESTVFVAGDSGYLYAVDLRTGTFRTSERLVEHSIFDVAVHPSGSTVAVGDRAGGVTFVDIKTLRPLAKFHAKAAVMSMVFTPDQRRLVVSALDRPVECWDLSVLESTLKPNYPQDKPLAPAQ